MNLTKIDKNIPLPPASRAYNGKHPWGYMRVGDSILLDNVTTAGGARSMAAKASKKYGWTFEYRPTGEGYRVWRTA